MTDEYEPRDEFRSASTNAALGLGAFGAVAPFVAPYFHEAVDKLTGANEPPPPEIELPPGVHVDE